jgi:hypothetical protein
MLINNASKHLKLKEKSSLPLIKRHGMKTYGGMECDFLAQALWKISPNGCSKGRPIRGFP